MDRDQEAQTHLHVPGPVVQGAGDTVSTETVGQG